MFCTSVGKQTVIGRSLSAAPVVDMSPVSWYINCFHLLCLGHESRALDNPHFRSTQWGQLDYAKILRLFFIQHTPPSTDGLSQPKSPSCNELCQQSDGPTFTKTFHVLPAVSVEAIRFGGADSPSMACLTHTQLMHRINDWIKVSGRM